MLSLRKEPSAPLSAAATNKNESSANNNSENGTDEEGTELITRASCV